MKQEEYNCHIFTTLTEVKHFCKLCKKHRLFVPGWLAIKLFNDQQISDVKHISKACLLYKNKKPVAWKLRLLRDYDYCALEIPWRFTRKAERNKGYQKIMDSHL